MKRLKPRTLYWIAKLKGMKTFIINCYDGKDRRIEKIISRLIEKE